MTEQRRRRRTQDERIRHSDWRALYVLQHPIAISLALQAVVAGVVIAFLPGQLDDTLLGRSIPNGVDRLWAAEYFAGGVLALVGIRRLSARLEAAGYALLGAAFTVYAIAIIAASGTHVFFAGIAAVGMAFGCAWRAFNLTTSSPYSVQPWSRRR